LTKSLLTPATAALQTHFPTLAAKTIGDMKWKKFFYRQLCERAGIPICKSLRRMLRLPGVLRAGILNSQMPALRAAWSLPVTACAFETPVSIGLQGDDASGEGESKKAGSPCGEPAFCLT
jgi:NifQ